MKQLFSLCLAMLLAQSSLAQGELVVNEVSQGSNAAREWIELVVSGPPGETLDIRHWVIDDNNGDFTDCPGPNNGALVSTGISDGHIRFTDHGIWSEVPVGTILLIYSWDPTDVMSQAEIGDLEVDFEDEDCDFLRVIPVNSTNIYMEQSADFPHAPTMNFDCPANRTCPNGGDGDPAYTPSTYMPLDDDSFSGISGRIAFSNSRDACQVRADDYSYVHGFSWGIGDPGPCDAPPPTMDGGPDGLQITNTGGVNKVYWFANLVSDDFRDPANFIHSQASTVQSPGIPNNCPNAEWIGLMRRPQYVNEEILDTIMCIGDTIRLTLEGKLNANCVADDHDWVINSFSGLALPVEFGPNYVDLVAILAGEISVTVTAILDNLGLYDDAGCMGPEFPTSSDYIINIDIQDLNVDVFDPLPICQGESVDLADLNNSGIEMDMIVSYHDSEPVSQANELADTEVSPDETTDYYIWVQDVACDEVVTVTVTVNETPSLEPLDSIFLCPGDMYDLTDIVLVDSNMTDGAVSYHDDSPADASNELSESLVTIDGPITYHILVQNGDCTDEIPVDFDVLDLPQALEIADTVCGDVNGIGIFELNIDDLINGGSGNDVTYYEDENLLVEITPPLETTSTSIFAVVSDDNCDSEPVEISLFVTAALDIAESIFEQCVEEGDLALFDLDALLEDVQGMAESADWFEDTNLEDPISGIYSTGGATVYVVLYFDGCPSDPYAVDLVVNEMPMDSLVFNVCSLETIIEGNMLFDIDNPAGTVLIEDLSGADCDTMRHVQLIFDGVSSAILSQTICREDSVLVEGTVYDIDNPSGIDTLDIASVLGCDSVLEISLSFFDLDTFEIISTSCPGEFQEINGTVYDIDNPTGIEILENASINGCDSIVRIELNYLNDVEEIFNVSVCQGGFFEVNNVIYDEGNLFGRDTLVGQASNGCDSIIEVNLNIKEHQVLEVNGIFCIGSSLEYDGVIFDENNTSDTIILSGQASNGCDSFIRVDIEFQDAVYNFVHESICEGDILEVNGEIYDENNLVGSDTLFGESSEGCDSIIDVNLTLEMTQENLIDPTLCFGMNLMIEGEIYDESNPSDVIILESGAANGCDSIITIDLNFYQEARLDISENLCAGDTFTINDIDYFETNLIGRDTIFGGSVDGCDSIISVELELVQASDFLISQDICPGEEIEVNSVIYDEDNLIGQELIENGSAFGCDSIITINLTLLEHAEMIIETDVCPGDTLLINGVAYHTGNLAGIEILEAVASNGCDSIITIGLSSISESISFVRDTVALFDTVTVSGVQFFAEYPADQIILESASINGCDSIIDVLIDFVGLSIDAQAFAPLCKEDISTLEVTGVSSSAYPIEITNVLTGMTWIVNSVNDFPFQIENLAFGLGEFYFRDATGLEGLFEYILEEPDFITYDKIVVYEGNFGEQITFDVFPEDIFVTVRWTPAEGLSCDDCLSPLHEIDQNRVYEVEAMDSNGCTYLAEVRIVADINSSIYIPNIFSPNGDSLNDEFKVYAENDNTPVHFFRIFNRWGSLIYEEANSSVGEIQGWNGFWQSKESNPGVYTYAIGMSLPSGEEKVFSGDITLVR